MFSTCLKKYFLKPNIRLPNLHILLVLWMEKGASTSDILNKGNTGRVINGIPCSKLQVVMNALLFGWKILLEVLKIRDIDGLAKKHSVDQFLTGKLQGKCWITFCLIFFLISLLKNLNAKLWLHTDLRAIT